MLFLKLDVGGELIGSDAGRRGQCRRCVRRRRRRGRRGEDEKEKALSVGTRVALGPGVGRKSIAQNVPAFLI